MANYNMNRVASNNAQVCKDGACIENLDISSYDTTVRAFHWNGTSGVTELCDGINYNANTGEGTITAESEIQICIDAWQTAYDEIQAQLQSEIPSEEV